MRKQTNIPSHNKGSFLALTIPALAVGLTTAHSAVIAPQTGGGAGIDPSGNSEIDAAATSSALLATFEALAGRTTQVNWSGISGAIGNTIDGNDIDVRIDHGTPFVASSSSLQNYNTGNSGGGYQWTGTNGQQLTISFGTESAGFTNDRSVQSAGFALLNFGGAYTDVTINYLDASNSVLSTQNFMGAPDSQGSSFGGADYFSGYTSTSPDIAKITIDLTRSSAGSGSSLVGLDALTYVAIPEPSSALLFGLGLMAATGRRKR